MLRRYGDSKQKITLIPQRRLKHQVSKLYIMFLNALMAVDKCHNVLLKKCNLQWFSSIYVKEKQPLFFLSIPESHEYSLIPKCTDFDIPV